MIYRPFAISLVFVGALLIEPAPHAQTRAGTGFFPPASRSSQPRPMNFNRPAFRSGQAHRHHRYINYGPYFYPSFYPSDYAESTPEPLPPQGYEDEHAAPSVAAPAKPAESMVVELRGDRWVRLTSSGPQEVVVPSPHASSGTTKSLAAFAQSSASPAVPLQPATLVFRDGHQEEAARYTIVGSTIYLKSDYYATGTWVRKIPLSNVDVPATRKLNRERGVAFSLPSRPSEIILRP